MHMSRLGSSGYLLGAVTCFSLLGLSGCPASDSERKPAPAAAPAATSTPAASAAAAASAAVSVPAAAAAPADPAAPAPGDLPAPADVAAAPADAQKTPSGLASKVLQKGTGKEHPTAQDTVEVHYTGWMTNGKMFDSSVKRGSTAKFPLNRVIKGWTEGVQLMVVGEKRRFWIPADLAYGNNPSRPGGPSGTLVFDVELVNIQQAPKTPPDVAAVPKDAKKTASGLAYRVLQKGTGTTHPAATSQVQVHYSGWTLDGKLFDSSVVRGQPIVFPLNEVIPGWTEGVQLMVEGEKTRFWIPGKMAYGDQPTRPGVPAGMLVFDVELLKILP